MPIFGNHPSLDRANLSNSQPKHLTIVSISSVLKSFLEQIANRMWVKEGIMFFLFGGFWYVGVHKLLLLLVLLLSGSAVE